MTLGFTSDVIGIQSRAADGFVCEYIGSSFVADLQWEAASNVMYYVFVGVPRPDSGRLFELDSSLTATWRLRHSGNLTSTT